MYCKKKVRKQLYYQQFGKCCWCDHRMSLEEATIEHIRAKSVGGTDDIENLQVACAACNHERGVRLFQAIQEERRLADERRKAEEEKQEYWRKHKLPTSKFKRKLPRGRKRIFDRFPPARYIRQHDLTDEA
jgi:5-methylcytosine-specific restriction endonuclease McrA